MDNNFFRNGILLAAGGYLVYLGINTIRVMYNGGLEKTWYFFLISVVFIFAGVFTFIRVIIRMTKGNKPDEDTETGDTVPEDDPGNELIKTDNSVDNENETKGKDIQSRLDALNIPKEEQETEK